MADPTPLVVPKNGPDCERTGEISDQRFHSALVAGLARVANAIGRGNLADRSGRTTRGLDKVFSGENGCKYYKGLTDFLRADPTALDEVLALYGYGLHRLPDPTASDDPTTLKDVIAFAGALSTGGSDHRSRMKLADTARPVAQAACGIVAEANRLRGVG